MKFTLNPGVQAAGTYLLNNGTLLSSDISLTTEQRSKVRALSLGDISTYGQSDNISRWIACGGNFTSLASRLWCTQSIVSYDTGNGYYSSPGSVRNGKPLSVKALESTINNGYDYTYFPALNYCYSFDFGTIGTTIGMGYMMCLNEYELFNNSSVMSNWKSVTGNTLVAETSWTYFWEIEQKNKAYPYVACFYSTQWRGYGGYQFYADNSHSIIPAIQFS